MVIVALNDNCQIVPGVPIPKNIQPANESLANIVSTNQSPDVRAPMCIVRTLVALTSPGW